MKNFIIEMYGKDDYQHLLGEMDKSSRDILSGIIISGQWYDIKVYQDLVGAVLKTKGKAELMKLNKELGKQQLRGLFGFVTKFVSAEQVMKKGQMLWKRLHSEGSVEVKEFSETKIVIEVHDFQFSEAHLIGTAAYFEGLIEVLLQKDAEYQTFQPSEREYQFVYTFK